MAQADTDSNSPVVPVVDPYQTYLDDPKKMNDTVSGLKDAISALPKNTKKVLRYLAKDSLNPYKPVSVECDFAGKLDVYLKQRNDSLDLANAVRWGIICPSESESAKIFTGDLFNRIGEKMNGTKEGGPGFLEMNDFLKEMTKEGVLYRSQQPNSEAMYALTPEASEAVKIVNKVRKFPWSYPIDILPNGPFVSKEQKKSKAFPKYVERFLELEMKIINGE
jgi:hypothetical protein